MIYLNTCVMLSTVGTCIKMLIIAGIIECIHPITNKICCLCFKMNLLRIMRILNNKELIIHGVRERYNNPLCNFFFSVISLNKFFFIFFINGF